MKQIEEKLDSIEEVLTILIKKVSGLENLDFEKKEPTASIDPVLMEIRNSVAKMPSGHLMLSEIYRLRKSIDETSKNPAKEMDGMMTWRSRSVLLATYILLIMVTCGTVALKFISKDNARLREMNVKYTAAQKLEPQLFTWIDSIYAKKQYWPIDSLMLMREQNFKNTSSGPSVNARKRKHSFR